MHKGNLLLESILEADGMYLWLLLLTPLVLYLIHHRADSLPDLPGLVTLPLSTVFSIPFTSSVRLIAARSMDFAGSSEKEGVSQQLAAWGFKEMAVNPLLLYGKKASRMGKTNWADYVSGCTGKLWWENKDARNAETSLENNKVKWAVQR